MTEFPERSITSRSVIGLCVVLIGVVLTASNLGLVRPFELWQFFPLGLTALGIAKLVDCRTSSTRWFSVLLIVVGLWWTLDNVYYIPFHIWRWWPLILVAYGVRIVMRSRELAAAPRPAPRNDSAPFGSGGSPASGSAPDLGNSNFGAPTSSFSSVPPLSSSARPGLDETITAVAFWSGSRRRSASPNFRSADAIAVMGGVELDLRQASTATGEAILDVFVMWGSVRVRVPPDWTVVNEVVPIMGGSDDRTTGTQPPAHRLRVRGVVVMGGVDIRS